MDKFELANALMGQLSRGATAGNAAQTTTWVGIATEDSENGVVSVDFGGDTVGDEQSIEIYTTARVKAGDPVIVSALGASGTGKEMVVAGVIGGGDALATEIQSVAENAEDTYMTILDFNTYYESLNSIIDARVDLKQESYGYALDISEIKQSLGELGSQVSDINGMILLGAVLDPETNQPVVGIAIAETIRTDGTTTTVDNVDYPTISSGQTFGLYTSKGWQFWVGGRKQGWFDSNDGHLHLKKTTAEESLVIGSDQGSWTSGGGPNNLFDESTATIYTRYFDSNDIWRNASDSRSYAIACSPSTTYTLKPNNENIIIFRVGYLTSATLPTSSSTTRQIYGVVRKTDNSAITITTGSNATYLVVQLNAGIVAERNTQLQIQKGSSVDPWSNIKPLWEIVESNGFGVRLMR